MGADEQALRRARARPLPSLPVLRGKGQGLRWDSPSSREKREELAARAGRGAQSAGFCAGESVTSGSIGYVPEQHPTLKAGGNLASTGAILATRSGKQPKALAVRMREGCAGGGKGPLILGDGMVVRRLTPTECERLQGFPSGWTDVPYRGREHPADTPRYKAIGNSMAVPVMQWIGKRIAAYELLEGGES